MHCSILGCDKPAEKRGWCGMHYRRWQRHGDPYRERPSPLARFHQKYEVTPTGCWLWTGGLFAGDGGGYGQFYVDGRNWHAHRWAYTVLVRPLDDDETLDHLCRVRPCVNPDHLEPVPIAVNLLRGVGAPARNARKTHCVRGHELTGDNVTRFGPDLRWRRCRACR